MATLAGRYMLERRLGGGGMAEVFLGKLVGRDGFSRQVAIKRVLAHLATDDAFAKMFVAEAQMCARLQHPNIVSVLDFDRDDDGRPFLVIELVDGPSLAELDGAVPVATALHLVTELLRGLAYAHDLPGEGGVRGVIHRDISPHNVLLSWEGAVKLSDFGIAKARAASGVTASELLKGKPAYMSPEQANGEPLDGRSDLFSVGIVLWELLVGRALFSGHTTQETLARVLFAPVPSPRSIRAEVPEDVDAVVVKMLAREKSERYPDASAAISALVACKDFPRDGREKLVALLADRFEANAPQRARMLGEVPTVRTPAEYAPTLPAPRDARPSRMRPFVLALAFAALGIAGAAVAATLFASRSDDDRRGLVVVDTTRDAAAFDEPGARATDASLWTTLDRAIGTTPEASTIDAATTDALTAEASTITSHPATSDAATHARPSKVGKTPSEAELAAERARILLASKGPASVPFSPPDETAVDASVYLRRARQEVRRLFGRDGTLTALHFAGFNADGVIDGTKWGNGIGLVFTISPPTDDGFHCVEFTSNYANTGGRFRMSLMKSGEYCKTLRAGASSIPRCTANEVYQRSHANYPESSLLTAHFRSGWWDVTADDSNVTKVPDDCR